MREAEQGDFVEKLVESAATADDAKMEALERVVSGIIGGSVERKPAAGSFRAGAPTFRSVFGRWVSGELADEFPDHVARKRSADMDRYRSKHVPGWAKDTAISAWSADTYERVMRELPKALGASSRRHVAQLLHRTLELCVYPLRLIPTNPIVRGMLPKVTTDKELAALCPDDPLLREADPAPPMA